MKTVLLVFGTRPEAIKMCPLVNELKKRKKIKTLVAVTGQHKEMLSGVLSAFGVCPDFDLAVMKKGQSLFDITKEILGKLEGVLDTLSPDVVLVHGDTTTAFAAALSGFYKKIPVGHVEAGLRTYDINSPYPEELNRRAISLLADYHFAPTPSAKENLIKEGVRQERVYVTGNTVIDALKTTVCADYTHPALEWAKDSRLILLTAHRRENQGRAMQQMLRAIRRVLDAQGNVKAIYPVHMNPFVQAAAEEAFAGCNKIRLLPPLEVFDFHNFLAQSFAVLTDSGGIQEEAAFLGRPLLLMRSTSERPEGIAAGVASLVGTEEAAVYQSFKALLEDKALYRAMAKKCLAYGDGRASVRIADIVEQI